MPLKEEAPGSPLHGFVGSKRPYVLGKEETEQNHRLAYHCSNIADKGASYCTKVFFVARQKLQVGPEAVLAVR
jgi:hypothetical protein